MDSAFSSERCRRTAVLTLCMVNAVMMGAHAQPLLGLWSMDGGDPYHTNRVNSTIVTRTDGTVKWRVELPSGMIVSRPVLGLNHMMYVSALGYLYALDRRTGAQIWNISIGPWDNVAAPAVGADGTVFFPSGYQYVFALNGSTGAVKWSLYVSLVGNGCSPTIGPDGTVYMGSPIGILAVNGSSSAQKWVVPTSFDGDVSTPALSASGILYTGSFDGHLYAINASTGLPLWTLAVDNGFQDAPTLVGEVLLVGGMDYNMYGVNSSNGKVLWRIQTFEIPTAVAIDRNGLAYFASLNETLDGVLFCVEPESGNITWTFPLMAASSGPALGADGTLYIASGFPNNSLLAIDLGTREAMWALPITTNDSFRGAIIDADGTVYATTFNGSVYAFQALPM